MDRLPCYGLIAARTKTVSGPNLSPVQVMVYSVAFNVSNSDGQSVNLYQQDDGIGRIAHPQFDYSASPIHWRLN